MRSLLPGLPTTPGKTSLDWPKKWYESFEASQDRCKEIVIGFANQLGIKRMYGISRIAGGS